MSAGTREGGRPLLTLVIPTRNEEGNVPRLVRELEDALSGVDYRVVFVDDSTDETPQAIRSISERDGRVVLIQRAEAEREGRGGGRERVHLRDGRGSPASPR